MEAISDFFSGSDHVITKSEYPPNKTFTRPPHKIRWPSMGSHIGGDYEYSNSHQKGKSPRIYLEALRSNGTRTAENDSVPKTPKKIN